jgi:hypothetical protein
MRTFEIDHRNNTGLHRLYVRYALEELAVLEEALKELDAFSRWSACVFSQAIREQIQSNVEKEAAWFEAAALRYTHADTSEFFLEA